MSDLFAGIAPDGSTRFIGEVGRGRACDCRCPECGSPLVAKQGALKVWHFAHEGGQERPECAVGAANMLRRLAIEVLQQREELQLPTWRSTVRVRVGTFRDEELVCLPGETRVAWTWSVDPPQRAPAATSVLSDGVPVELYVDIGAGPTSQVSSDTARISFWLPIPALEHLQLRSSAVEEIERTGQWIWMSRPDPAGLLAAIESRLRTSLEAREQERQAAADRAAAASALSEVRELEERQLAARAAEEEADRQAERRARLRADLAPGLTPGHDGQSSLMLYEVAPGSASRKAVAEAWIVYTLGDGDLALRPWPSTGGPELPREIGRWDASIGVYRAPMVDSTLYLNRQRLTVRNTSDVGQLAEWVDALSSRADGEETSLDGVPRPSERGGTGR